MRDSPTPPNRQGFKGFRQEQLTVSPFEGRLGKFCTAAIALFLKVGVFRPSCKEVRKCRLQVSQALLQGDATNVIKEIKILLFFLCSQQTRGFGVANSLLPFVPCLCSGPESAVVDQSSTAQGSPKQGFLLGSRIEAVLESFLCHACILALTL